MKYLILCSFITLLSFKSFGFADVVAKADIFLSESEYDSAVYYFDIAISNRKNSSNDTILAALYVQKGKALKLNEEFELALIDYKSALNLYKKCNNVNGVVNSLTHLAEFYRSIHEFEKALSYIEEAKELVDYPTVTINNKAYFYNRYAAALTEGTLDRELPIKYSKIAIVLAKQCGSKDIEASSLNELGFIYKEKDPSIAIEYYFNALQIYKEINSKRYIASILVNIARTYHDIDDFKNSIKYCNQGLKIAENTEWNMIKRDLYFYLYRSYEGLQKSFRSIE